MQKTEIEKTEWYRLDQSALLAQLKTDAEVGLSEVDAERRLKAMGANVIESDDAKSMLKILLAQFQDFMILVLAAATLISALLGEYIDAIAIVAIVVLNSVLGFIQEARAERSLAALKALSAPRSRVLRDGALKLIDAKMLVPGDIVYLEAGDRVGADLRLLYTSGLLIDASMLTGESLPVEKTSKMLDEPHLPLADQSNMAHMGTLVMKGRGIGVVVATGEETAMGKIADLLRTTDDIETPLSRRLKHLGEVLIVASLILTSLVIVLGTMRGYPFQEMFLTGVTLAVAAIPEGLPTIVTIVLALGVSRMLRRGAIVRRLASVETLGSTTFICTDKTGTLTENRMRVVDIRHGEAHYEVGGSGYEPKGTFVLVAGSEKKGANLLNFLLTLGVLGSHARLIPPLQTGESRRRKKMRLFYPWHRHRKSTLPQEGADREAWQIEGDPTEGALIVAAQKKGLDPEAIRARWPLVHELPFDSTRKRMALVYDLGDGTGMMVVKGAFEVILERAEYEETGHETEGLVRLTPGRRKNWQVQAEAMAEKGLRVLALAYRRAPLEKLKKMEDEAELILVGLMGMMDPPRDDVFGAIAAVHAAGIGVAMITGDHPKTAESIARKLGMLHPGKKILTGEDLRRLDEASLEREVEKVAVYARVSPEDKLRIVKALKKKGHIVAMTGDGTNDAPALKAADIGVAMGLSGTEVAKEAADIILTNDHFGTLEAAIEEGRTIYENIRKFVRYLLASNVGEIMVMMVALMLAWPVPLTPLMILWINLVTDGLPALALGVDGMEHDLMKRPPRPPQESIFARRLGYKIITRGILITMVTLMSFYDRLSAGAPLEEAQTVAFLTLVMTQLIHVFDARSAHSIFKRHPFDNMPLVLAVLSSILLMLWVIMWPPAQQIFGTTSLSIYDWFMSLGYAVLPFIVVGLTRFFLDLMRKMSRGRA